MEAAAPSAAVEQQVSGRDPVDRAAGGRRLRTVIVALIACAALSGGSATRAVDATSLDSADGGIGRLDAAAEPTSSADRLYLGIDVPQTPSAARLGEQRVGMPRRVMTDVAYGALTEQVLDVYIPAGLRHDGVIVWLHGGSWWAGDKSNLGSGTGFDSPLIRYLSDEHGWTVVSVNYRLSGAAPFPAQIHDVLTALRWVGRNTELLGVSADRIVVAGYSAGGYLAAMAAVGWNSPALQPPGDIDDGEAIRPMAAMSLSAPIDPVAWAASSVDDPLAGSGSVARLLACPDLATTSSCAAEQLQTLRLDQYADAQDPHLYLAHGDADRVVPLGDQRPMIETLQGAIGPDAVWFEEVASTGLPGPGHQIDTAMDLDVVVHFLDDVARHPDSERDSEP